MTFTMSKAKAEEFTDRLYDQAGDLMVDPRFDYSGRSMYGSTCVGFVTDKPTKLAMTVAVILADWEREYDDEGKDYDFPLWYELNTATDNMAFDTIVYFPNWRIED